MINVSGQIKMTPDELRAKATIYGKSGDDINTMLTELQRTQGELMDQWEGQAFRRFDEQFQELSVKVNDFSELMRQIETQLTQTADAMAEQDEALSRNFGFR